MSGDRFSFDRKILFLIEFILFWKKYICWQKFSMLNFWKEFFWQEFLLLEKNYSDQEYNFCGHEINVLRSWKDFCPSILLFWKEFILCWKNKFLLDINMLRSWKDLFLSIYTFLIPIQNSTKTRDLRPIFRFNFKIFRSAGLPRWQIKSHPAMCHLRLNICF